MLQEQERPVRDAWRSRSEASLVSLVFSLVKNRVGVLILVHAEGRVAEHVVKSHPCRLVVGQRVALVDTFLTFTFDHDVRFCNRIGLRVELLPEHLKTRSAIQLSDALSGD